MMNFLPCAWISVFLTAAADSAGLQEAAGSAGIELLAMIVAGVVLLGITLLFYRVLNPKPRDNTLKRKKRN